MASPDTDRAVPALPPPPTPMAPAAAPAALPLHPRDLQGLAQLVTDGSVGVVDLVEALHRTIAGLAPPVGAAAPADATPLAASVAVPVYGAVRGGMRLAGKGADLLLGLVGQWLPRSPSPPAREAVLAAINGLWGDHLAEQKNPLAIPMSLRRNGQALALQREALATHFAREGVAPSSRLLVMVHGLCMNDLQWERNGHDHGRLLAAELGATALYLHYNSGLHVSTNGRSFAALLEALVAQWPVPVTELLLVGHSMGGLVIRSACHVAGCEKLAWLPRLRAVACLGTPHHGAPAERGGHWIDVLLGVSPYAAPFARLGRTRSAGITDLRFGNLQDADWQGRDRHAQRHDDRVPTPPPPGVPLFLVAATTGDEAGSWRSTVLGDGLVRLSSAFGHHRNEALALQLPASHRLLITGANHWDLLDRAEVHTQLRDWLTPLRAAQVANEGSPGRQA